MHSRRLFLQGLVTAGGAALSFDLPTLAQHLAGQSSLAAINSGMDLTACFKGTKVFDSILAKAKSGNWQSLPMGDLMGKIATQLLGTPYVANTLELSSTKEFCSVNLTALDCVTFFESTLGFARMLKKGGSTPADLVREVIYTRYRGGKVGDYSSRLHYTSDWFYDNEQKHVVKLLSDLPGSEPFKQKVGFMSTHPDSYKQFGAHPELVQKVHAQEVAINSRTLNYVPLDKISAVESYLATGDIVGVCTSITGLDIVHTGLVLKNESGVHFMDATSKKAKMQVVIEPGPISQALRWSNTLTGAIFARPLPPS